MVEPQRVLVHSRLPTFHVFVVDKYSFPVHSDRLFCGVKNPRNLSQRISVYADLLATRPGDFVLFYQRRIDENPEQRGFRGLYRVVGPPFVDTKTVKSQDQTVLGACPHCNQPFSEKLNEDGSGTAYCRNPNCKHPLSPTEHILPNRLPIELVQYFERPVDDNSAYIDRTDDGTLWTMIFRKQFGAGRERSINHILPEEGEKLRRLLLRGNDGRPSTPPDGLPHGYPSGSRTPIRVTYPPEAPFTAESYLYAWLNENVDSADPVLRQVLGPVPRIEYAGNQVLYGIGGDAMDYLVLHRKERGDAVGFDAELPGDAERAIGEQAGRYAATVIEVKKGAVDEDTLNQVDRYAYYVAQVASANCLPEPPATLLVRPVLLGHGQAASLLAKLQTRSSRRILLNYPGGRTTTVFVTRPVVLDYHCADGKPGVSVVN